MLHGTADRLVPYVNGKAVYDRAQSQKIASTMITMDGLGHVPWDDILNTYLTDMTTSLYQEVTKGAQAPDGCEALPDPSLFLQ